MEDRQKIPVPRHSFLWSLNETSGEILTHVGPTEFTPSANDRIVRASGRGGFESASMEARSFVIARDGQYVLLENPLAKFVPEDGPNGSWVPGGNKEKNLRLGTIKVVPGPCAFPLWPGQYAEVRPAHKLTANHFLIIEVIGEVDESAPYFPLVKRSAALSSVVIEAEEPSETEDPSEDSHSAPDVLRIGDRIVIQGRHTQHFIPPSGISVVPPTEEMDSQRELGDGLATLPNSAREELGQLLAQINEGITGRQFSMLKNELRHRQDLNTGQRAVMLTSLDELWAERQSTQKKRSGGDVQSSSIDPYARKAVVLGPKNFCYLFDADGKPRIVRGPARVFPGPHDTFLYRGSRRRVYDAYELGKNEALLLRIITPISKNELEKRLPKGTLPEEEHYDTGHLLLVRGLPSVFFPFIEAEVLRPDSLEPHVGNDHHNAVIQAVGIDQKSGIYVSDLRTGMVKMVRGETSYLVDPRSEEHIHRRVPAELWNLWIAHTEPQKTAREDVVTPWAISVTIPNNEAVLITSRHGRRAVLGPKTELLEFEEMLTPLRLSKGPSKDGSSQINSCFLRTQGGRVSDKFSLESSDFVRFNLRLGLAGRFEGDPEKWFQVEDPIRLLADRVRATIRENARSLVATKLIREIPSLVRDSLLGDEGSMKFEENGMVLDSVDVLSFEIEDPGLFSLFREMQKEAVTLQLKDEQAQRRLESTKLNDQIETEEHQLQRQSSKRMSETYQAEAQDNHSVEEKKALLAQELEGKKLELQHEFHRKVAEFKRFSQIFDAETFATVTTKEAEAKSQASGMTDEQKLKSAEAFAEIERKTAQALSEADALRLRSIQKELVGALQSAADSEVMKAAAQNMNLVSLLSGKSPAELFDGLLKGTPLSRTVQSLAARSDKPAESSDSDE